MLGVHGKCTSMLATYNKIIKMIKIVSNNLSQDEKSLSNLIFVDPKLWDFPPLKLDGMLICIFSYYTMHIFLVHVIISIALLQNASLYELTCMFINNKSLFNSYDNYLSSFNILRRVYIMPF